MTKKSDLANRATGSIKLERTSAAKEEAELDLFLELVGTNTADMPGLDFDDDYDFDWDEEECCGGC